MELFALLVAIVSLFVLIGVGFALRRYGILTGDHVHLIAHVLVNVALPALTISSMQVPDTTQNLEIVDSMLFVAFCYYFIAFLISVLVCRYIAASRAETGVIEFMLVFPNTMFMGIPVALAVFGPSSLFPVVMFNLPFYFLVFTLGVWLLARGRPGKLDPKALLSPGLIASIAGIGLFLAGFMLPLPVDSALGVIGSATTPLAMLVVGALLATLPVKKLAGDMRIYLVTALRLVVFPAIAFLILSHFISDRLLVGVAVLLIAMPVAANSVLLSEEYEVDSTLASQGVLITTVLCLVTIPVLAWLFL